VLSYNASAHIAATIDRIPKDAFDLIDEIFIFDDCSPDNTFKVAEELKEESFWKTKLNVYKNPRNLRYGGNQKAGYRYAIEKGLDYVIMLHGDGQYAPEYIPDLMFPAVTQGEKVVFASRMINKKDALMGGMPLYKFVGNQVLTRFENLILGTKLFEFHSGYRMYSTDVLKKIPFEQNTHEFHFDTQIIVQCRALGVVICEIPIKTFYGDEECNVDGFRYAKDVVLTVLEYRLHQLHILRTGKYFLNRDFVLTRKRSPFSSHELILSLLKRLKAKRLVEFGGGNGILSQDMNELGLNVQSVERRRDSKAVKELGLQREYDVVLLNDNLPREVDDVTFVRDAQRLVAPEGTLIVVVPNIANWFYRLSLACGRFNYGDRGILSRENLHFYTRNSIIELLKQSGLSVKSVRSSTLPFEVVFESIGKSRFIKVIDRLYALAVKVWPKLFAYQFIIEASINHLNPAEGEGKITL
jgi:glycosyltransferase involved in cell wall biosynthesis